MDKFSGGCQCGAVRYAISGALGIASICHCRMCQKAFGSWGAALVVVPLENFTWSRGMPATFKSSEIVKRGFCANCGTPLFMHEHGDTNLDLAIGTLDNPNVVEKFDGQLGIEGRLAWFASLNALPEQRTEETRNSQDLLLLKSLQHPDFDTDVWPPEL